MRFWVRFSPTTNNYYARDRTWRPELAVAYLFSETQKTHEKYPPGNERTVWRALEIRNGERVIVE